MSEEGKFVKGMKKVFKNFFWLGVVVLLITIIVYEKLLVKYQNSIIFKTLIDLSTTLSISIVISGIFTWVSESSFFATKIMSLLKSVVLKRDFLSNLDIANKKEALKVLIEPSRFERNNFERVADYYSFYIDQTMDLSNKNIRSDYIANVEVSFEANIVQYITDITYRLFPNEKGFGLLKVGFEEQPGSKIGELISAKIGISSGEYVDITNMFKDNDDTIGGMKSILKTVDLNQDKIETIQLKEQKFLIVKLTLKEYGYDHWVPINFRTLQPTSSFSYVVNYPSDFHCVSYNTYGQAINYTIDDSQPHKLDIRTPQWLNEGAGINIIISNT